MSMLQEILQNDKFIELNIEEIEQLKIFKEIQLDLLMNSKITKNILDSIEEIKYLMTILKK